MKIIGNRCGEGVVGQGVDAAGLDHGGAASVWTLPRNGSLVMVRRRCSKSCGNTKFRGDPLERTTAAEQKIDRFLAEVLVVGAMGWRHA